MCVLDFESAHKLLVVYYDLRLRGAGNGVNGVASLGDHREEITGLFALDITNTE